jgi:hypothetical protein
VTGAGGAAVVVVVGTSVVVVVVAAVVVVNKLACDFLYGGNLNLFVGEDESSSYFSVVVPKVVDSFALYLEGLNFLTMFVLVSTGSGVVVDVVEVVT